MLTNERPSCSVENCEKPVRVAGACFKHDRERRQSPGFVPLTRVEAAALARAARKPKRPAIDRVWERVDWSGGPDACWPISGANTCGYGVVSHNGRQTRATRVILESLGHDLAGLQVLHSCDNPPCCNPAHLRPGTNQENSQEASERGRLPKGSARPGARLTEDQVREIRRRRAAGETCVGISADYGVGPSLIAQISRRVIWAHVEDEAC